jgi:hypothetical protein
MYLLLIDYIGFRVYQEEGVGMVQVGFRWGSGGVYFEKMDPLPKFAQNCLLNINPMSF